jgi:hypothetical protein
MLVLYHVQAICQQPATAQREWYMGVVCGATKDEADREARHKIDTLFPGITGWRVQQLWVDELRLYVYGSACEEEEL